MIRVLNDLDIFQWSGGVDRDLDKMDETRWRHAGRPGESESRVADVVSCLLPLGYTTKGLGPSQDRANQREDRETMETKEKGW